MVTPLRGQVFFLDLGYGYGVHPYVIISENRRNRSTKGDYLAVELTTTPLTPHREHLRELVELRNSRPITGVAKCGDIHTLEDRDLELYRGQPGQIAAADMQAIDDGLRHALGL